MAAYTIEIPGKPATLNHIQNRWQRAKEVAYWRSTGALALRIAGWGILEPPVDFTFTRLYVSGKPTDHEAFTWAVKGLKDSTVDAGLLKDDSPKYVWMTHTGNPIKCGRDAIVMKVEEVNPF